MAVACVSVCVLLMSRSWALHEPVEVLFGLWTQVGLRNHYIRWQPRSLLERDILKGNTWASSAFDILNLICRGSSDVAFGCCYYCSLLLLCNMYVLCLPSVLWRCWLGCRKGIRPVKNWVVGCWCGCLSGARCRLAYVPADATATHCLLLQ